MKFVLLLQLLGHFIWRQPIRSRCRHDWSPGTQLLDVSTWRRNFRAAVQRWFLASALGKNLCKQITIHLHRPQHGKQGGSSWVKLPDFGSAFPLVLCRLRWNENVNSCYWFCFVFKKLHSVVDLSVHFNTQWQTWTQYIASSRFTVLHATLKTYV